jgi:predicted ArsR family transcriptional regulator
MLDGFGIRQRELLLLLLENKDGLTIDDLVSSLGITRTAVSQHLAVLERDGYVEKGSLLKTLGRPVSTYIVTDKGRNLLPKQYSWFSELLVESIKDEFGSERLTQYLHKMARGVARQVKPRMAGKTSEEQIHELAKILTELSYQANTDAVDTQSGKPAIVATNCVYHNVAAKHPEVCEFDLALMSELLDDEVEHVECMVRGGSVCRFRFHPTEKTS